MTTAVADPAPCHPASVSASRVTVVPEQIRHVGVEAGRAARVIAGETRQRVARAHRSLGR